LSRKGNVSVQQQKAIDKHDFLLALEEDDAELVGCKFILLTHISSELVIVFSAVGV
jgi:hypothetical protein